MAAKKEKFYGCKVKPGERARGCAGGAKKIDITALKKLVDKASDDASRAQKSASGAKKAVEAVVRASGHIPHSELDFLSDEPLPKYAPPKAPPAAKSGPRRSAKITAKKKAS